MSNLILPDSVVQDDPKPKTEVMADPDPQQVDPEIQGLVSTVDKLLEELQSRGDAGIRGLFISRAFQIILTQYMTHLMPQVSTQVCLMDRGQLAQTIDKLKTDREIHVRMGQEKIDMLSYEAAVQDFSAIMRQLPPTQIVVKVDTPTKSETTSADLATV